VSTPGFYALTFKIGRRADIQGFQLRALLPSDEEWQLIQGRIREALRLIQSYSPVRFEHFKRDIQRLWVIGLPTARGSYVHDHAMCVLDFDYVTGAHTQVEELALTLVHEGTHARLRRRGFGYEEAIRGRIERICTRSELTLARRLPNGAALLVPREDRLKWDDSEWNNETRRRDELEALKELGWSGNLAYWITKFLLGRRSGLTRS